MNMHTGETKAMSDLSEAEKATGHWKPVDVVRIAQICHEANRAYCATIGDKSQMAWGQAPEWQRESAVKGVEFALSGNRTPEDSHNSWLAEKRATGWWYGPVKDPDKKEHPCLVPYDQLPANQQTKDHLFTAIVNVFKGVGT